MTQVHDDEILAILGHELGHWKLGKKQSRGIDIAYKQATTLRSRMQHLI